MTSRCVNPVIADGTAALETAVAKARADPTRPVYHFRPPAQWMNDVNGPLFHKGNYHIFYQLNPYKPHVGDGIHWGHARSRDLVYWEHLPLAIWPSTEKGETGCWSGTACFNGTGQPMIFYTKAGRLGPQREAAEPFEQWAAIGDDDLINWTKHPDNPILECERPDQPSFDWRWRDPFVFSEQGRTYMIVGAAGPGTPIYEAQDSELSRWAYRGFLCDISVECPNFFKLGEKWVLITSPHNPVHYYIGSFDTERLTFEAETEGRIEETRTFYGTNVLFDDELRCIFLGRLRRNKEDTTWNGCMALPRILTIGPDGHPRQVPVPELQKLRGKHYGISDVTLTGASRAIDGVNSDTLEIIAQLELNDAACFGLKVRCSPDAIGAVAIRYDRQTLTVAGVDVSCPLDETRKNLRLHIFLDKSVIKVFVDDGRKVATNFIDCSPADLGIEVFAESGSATIRSLDIWELKPIWTR